VQFVGLYYTMFSDVGN